jgi:VanZ family protein
MAANQNKGWSLLIFKFWLPVIICMGCISYMSSLPGEDIPLLFPFQDVVFHGIIYAVLGFLFLRAFKNSFRDLDFIGLLIVTVLFGLAYGILDEIHQIYVPGRSCSGFDILIDAAGSFIGGFAGLLAGL